MPDNYSLTPSLGFKKSLTSGNVQQDSLNVIGAEVYNNALLDVVSSGAITDASDSVLGIVNASQNPQIYVAWGNPGSITTIAGVTVGLPFRMIVLPTVVGMFSTANIRLKADFVPTARNKQSIELVWDGLNYYEVSRSLNL